MKFAVGFVALLVSTEAFVMKHIGIRHCTKLFIDDSIAELIDMALDRQRRHHEIEKKWEDQNKKMFEHEFSHELRAFEEQVIEISPRQRRKDALQAQTNPEAYCRDRCVAVGECEVFEDFYHMTPEQVMSFCKDCVLSDDDEPCDIPEFVNGGFHLHQL